MNHKIKNQDLSKPLVVLVTGVGSIIGQGIVQGLKKISRNIHVIGIDRNEYTFANVICDEFLKKPLFDSLDSNLLVYWKQILREKKIDLVIPGIEQDIKFLNRNRKEFKLENTKLVLNCSKLISLSADKWNTYQNLIDTDIALIPTEIDGDWQKISSRLGKPPYLIKPRNGYGSKGIHLVDNEIDYEYWRRKLGSQFMIQKYLNDSTNEYTIGSFGFGDGNSMEPLILKRKIFNSGITQWAEVCKNDQLHEFSCKLDQKFKPIGPTNYQFLEHSEKYYLLEVNPRISSSTSIRSKFGYNEAEMCVNFFHDKLTLEEKPIFRGKAMRFIEDYVVFE